LRLAPAGAGAAAPAGPAASRVEYSGSIGG